MRANDEIRVVVRTPSRVLFATEVAEIEAANTRGCYRIDPARDGLITSVLPGELVLRKADGSELCVRVGWGSLAMLNGEARITVDRAELAYLQPPLPMAV